MPYKDKIRIIRFSLLTFCETCVESRGMHLYFVDELTETNSYLIAINYNIDMINNLKETSKLYIPLLQLDSYILYNYNINSIGYTLSLQPLIITQKHLLSTYDNFFFTYKEKEKNNNINMAFQDIRDDVTTINEYAVFPDINVDSSKLCGNDYAVPISTQLLHEKSGHSKNEKKNNKEFSPLYFYIKKKIMKVSKGYQDIKYTKLNQEKGEAGLLVEYFIRYNKKNLLHELRSNYKLGNIIKNVKLFTGKNFKELANEIKNNKNENILLNTNVPVVCLNLNEDKIKTKIKETNVEQKERNPVKTGKEEGLDIKEESLEDYEKK